MDIGKSKRFERDVRWLLTRWRSMDATSASAVSLNSLADVKDARPNSALLS